jgi:hypothetical protein
MRLFDQADTDGKVGVYLDGINLRLEKTKDSEHKVVDLTWRVQPFTPELATRLHPDVRTLLFDLKSATPRPLLQGVQLKLPNLPKQHVDCWLLPDEEVGGFSLLHVEISDPRVRTEKGVDGYALIVYGTFGPLSAEELEYIVTWYSQQRFCVFREAQAVMDFAGKQPGELDEPPAAPRARKRPRSNPNEERSEATH